MEYIEKNELNIDTAIGIALIPDYNYCDNDICESDKSHKIEIDSFESYIVNVLGSSMIKNLKVIYNKYKNNTVLAINDKNSFNFDVSDEEKKEYMICGYNSTADFFEQIKQKKELEDTSESERYSCI